MTWADFVFGFIAGWCLGLSVAVSLCERLGHRK